MTPEQLRQKRQALAWLNNIAPKTPIGRWMNQCFICGKDSDGLSRCKKHDQEYSDVFFKTTQEFLAIFQGQM